MKRYFSVIEMMRVRYEVHTSDEFEAMLEEQELCFQDWLNENPPAVVWSTLEPEHDSILDYVETQKETFFEERL